MNPTFTSDHDSAGHVYVFPASFAERSLWFLDQLAPGSSLYNLHLGRRIYLNLNEVAFEQSINEIVRRHETLRTCFRVVDEEPVQVVASFLTIPLPVSDLRQLNEAIREDRAIQIANEEADRPFNLLKWPLMRVRLLRTDEEEYIFLLTIHHIVCDFWSMDVFEMELEVLYRAFAAGEPSPLPELPIQYADYSEWERQWLQGPIANSHLEYWKRQLRDLEPLQLPSDLPKARSSSYAGSAHDFSIEEPLYRALVQLSKREKTTLFMTMLAAFQTLLFRYTGQDDIAVGTPVANRTRAEVENLIAFFINSLVLRTDFSGNPTFRELLARVREVTLGAFAHQDLPFEKLVHELNPERGGGGHNPLFQVHFQLFGNTPELEVDSPLAGEPFGAETKTAKFDIALDIWEYPDGLYAHMEYSTALFSAETMVRMEQHLRTLLQGIVANPDQHLAELPLLTSPERQEIVFEWNRTDVPYAREECIHDLFEAQVERTPNAIALTYRQEDLSYEQLNYRANQLASYLRARGVGPRSLVAVYLERSAEMIIGLLGILKAGAAYLPLNPSEPTTRLRFMMEDAESQITLTQERFADSIPIPNAIHLCLDNEWGEVARCSGCNLDRIGSSQDPAYIMYTSGSTGSPKGVLVHSQAVCNHLLWMQASFPMNAEDRVLQKYPFNFDASVCEIFGPLLSGGRLIMADPSEHWDISQFIHLLRHHRITVLDLLPSMLRALLDEDEFRTCDFLRRVICGGEAISPELRDIFFLRMNAELHNIYGPTETTIGAASWTCRREHAGQPVPIGRPAANTQIYLLDHWKNPVPPLIPGELCISGDGVALGYLNAPELTASKFVPNPFAGEPSRMYCTGDLARYLPNGVIEYLGRIDEQVKIRGHRVEPQEIETVLTSHASVQECAVVAREEGRLAAYVVLETDAPQWWPSVGEYDVYDELLYYAMTHDELRNESYRSAIKAVVQGKVVLDIGTGADIVLSKYCVEGGAKRVYAVELREDACREAAKLIQKLGLTEKIILLRGESTSTQLSEKVDVCVSEILGTIGSSEGVVQVLNDARRFLKDGGVMVPRRCVTRVAAVSLPEELHSGPSLTELPRLYVERVFQRVGHCFDLRMCIKNLPESALLSSPGTFEELDFNGYISPDDETHVFLTIDKDSRLDGFLLWLTLSPGLTEPIDSFRDKLSWLPVFFPTFYPGVEVAAGDVIEADCRRWHHPGSLMPDYMISGTLHRKFRKPQPFHFCSPHSSTRFKDDPFYQALFAEWSYQPISSEKSNRVQSPPSPPASSGASVLTLRRFLQEQLPEYMIPSSIMILGRLPRNRNGKVDRRALPYPNQVRHEPLGSRETPSTDVERMIRDVWNDTLGLEAGLHDNFFDLGGDSLLITRVRSRLEVLLKKPISIVDLFQYPTVHSLAQFVGNGTEMDPFAAADDRARKQFEAAAEFQQRMGVTHNA
jgi:amino acid adenylation domain-containing protein